MTKHFIPILHGGSFNLLLDVNVMAQQLNGIWLKALANNNLLFIQKWHSFDCRTAGWCKLGFKSVFVCFVSARQIIWLMSAKTPVRVHVFIVVVVDDTCYKEQNKQKIKKYVFTSRIYFDLIHLGDTTVNEFSYLVVLIASEWFWISTKHTKISSNCSTILIDGRIVFHFGNVNICVKIKFDLLRIERVISRVGIGILVLGSYVAIVTSCHCTFRWIFYINGTRLYQPRTIQNIYIMRTQFDDCWILTLLLSDWSILLKIHTQIIQPFVSFDGTIKIISV